MLDFRAHNIGRRVESRREVSKSLRQNDRATAALTEATLARYKAGSRLRMMSKAPTLPATMRGRKSLSLHVVIWELR